MSSQSQTYWDTDPVEESRSVQLPEFMQGFSAHDVDGLLHVVPVKPGGQMHFVELVVGEAVT